MYCLSDSDHTDNEKYCDGSDSEATIIDWDTVQPSKSNNSSSRDSGKLVEDNDLLSNKRTLDSNKYCKDLLKITTDPELEAILRKYSGDSQVQNSTTTSNELVDCVEVSSEDELPQIKQVTTKELGDAITNKGLLVDVLVHEDLDPNPAKKRIKLASEEKERQKLERQAERARKKEMAEQEKLAKRARASAKKKLKPDEAIKFITVLLDTEIANEEYGGEVINTLQSASINYRLQPQLVPKCVTWSRIAEHHSVDNHGILQHSLETLQTDNTLILMNWKEIVHLIHNNELIKHIQSLQSIMSFKQLLLGIYGIQGYFNHLKNETQRNFRNELTQQDQSAGSKTNKKYMGVPKISRDALELALTELQVECSCCHRLLQTNLDIANLILHFSKAVAQAPFKAERHQKQQEADRYVWEDNKNVVHVNKEGFGLQRLWQQQLMSFPLARIEHAEAISMKFPTLRSLMEEYNKCSQEEGESLLQDIPVRRAAGPLTTVRKIGPELSKKIYNVLVSTDGNITI